MLLSFINVFVYKDASPSKHVNALSISSGVAALPATTPPLLLLLLGLPLKRKKKNQASFTWLRCIFLVLCSAASSRITSGYLILTTLKGPCHLTLSFFLTFHDPVRDSATKPWTRLCILMALLLDHNISSRIPVIFPNSS